MIDQVTFLLFIVSLVVLLLVLVILFVLCWTLKASRNRNFIELQIAVGEPANILTIRTEPTNVHQVLDHLLDRVIVQEEPRTEECEEEPAEEVGGGEEHGPDFPLDPEFASAWSLRDNVNNLSSKVWKWITLEDTSSDTSAPDEDETDDRCPRVSSASPDSEVASCSTCWEDEEQHDESEKEK